MSSRTSPGETSMTTIRRSTPSRARQVRRRPRPASFRACHRAACGSLCDFRDRPALFAESGVVFGSDVELSLFFILSLGVVLCIGRIDVDESAIFPCAFLPYSISREQTAPLRACCFEFMTIRIRYLFFTLSTRRLNGPNITN